VRIAPAPVREYAGADELRTHYRDTHARLWGAQAVPPPPEPQAEPEPPPAAPTPCPVATPAEPVPAMALPDHSQGRTIATVCNAYKITRDQLFTPNRKALPVARRRVAMALLREFNGLAMAHIGRIMGLDHTTVLYSLNEIEPTIAAVRAWLGPDATVEHWACALRDALTPPDA
jgi:hypothetical protein